MQCRSMLGGRQESSQYTETRDEIERRTAGAYPPPPPAARRPPAGAGAQPRTHTVITVAQ
eukprot:scaffold1581_cov127-Isochrysis_galbana.AAC.5